MVLSVCLKRCARTIVNVYRAKKTFHRAIANKILVVPYFYSYSENAVVHVFKKHVSCIKICHSNTYNTSLVRNHQRSLHAQAHLPSCPLLPGYSASTSSSHISAETSPALIAPTDESTHRVQLIHSNTPEPGHSIPNILPYIAKL